MKKGLLYAFAVLRIIVGAVLIITAYNCYTEAESLRVIANDKLMYYHSEDYPTLNKNVYVGGDAYNYIINGTYFSGYSALAAGKYVTSAICGCTGAMLILYSIPIKGKDTNKKPSSGLNNDFDDLPEI